MISKILAPYIQAYTQAKTENIEADFICESRDVFRARSERWFRSLIPVVGVDKSAQLLTIVGEIGNNCYDHNLGRWQDRPGLCFFYVPGLALIFDNGQGIYASLSLAGYKFESEKAFLNAALTERITGRKPESRGNGLKLVMKYVNELQIEFATQTGDAMYCTQGFDSGTLKLLALSHNLGVISIIDFRNLLK